MFKVLKEDGDPVSTRNGTIYVFGKADDAINFAHNNEPFQDAFTVVAFGRDESIR